MGELAARIGDEVGCVVVALDLSPRMVELARERGVDAHVADVQEIPLAEGEFDAIVAAWMLYHVPDLERVASPRSHASFGRVVRSSRSRTAPATSTRCGISSAGISSLGGGRSGRRTASSSSVATSSRFGVSTWWGRCGFLTQTRSVGTRIVRPRPGLRRPGPRLGGTSRGDEDRRRVRADHRAPLRRRVPVHARATAARLAADGRRESKLQTATCSPARRPRVSQRRRGRGTRRGSSTR